MNTHQAIIATMKALNIADNDCNVLSKQKVTVRAEQGHMIKVQELSTGKRFIALVGSKVLQTEEVK